MREISYRAKRKDNGEWVYGVPLKEGYSQEVEMLWYEYGSLVYTERVQVIPETVGQYTGLTDKNGKKIWEGDIVDCWSEGVNAKGTVQQRKDGMWIIYPSWQNKIMWGLCPDEYSKTTVEVIGNVFDNPEMLEVK